MVNGLFNRLRGTRKEMSFVDHLEELRWHLIRMVIAILVCAIVVCIYHAWVLDTVILGPTRQDFASYKAFCWLSQALHLGGKPGEGLCLLVFSFCLQSVVSSGLFFC